MELRQLRFATTLAAELHFGRAAEREHITEPALSQQIRQLEQEFGVKLFDRSSRRVQLTQAGAVFIEHAQRVIAEAEETVLATREAGEGRSGIFESAFRRRPSLPASGRSCAPSDLASRKSRAQSPRGAMAGSSSTSGTIA